MLYVNNFSSCQDFLHLCDDARGLPAEVDTGTINDFLRILNAIIFVASIGPVKQDIDEHNQIQRQMLHFKTLCELFKYLRGDARVL